MSFSKEIKIVSKCFVSINPRAVLQFLLFNFQCDNHEIRPGKYLGVCISVANNRLFVGSIPKNKTRESILEDFGKVTGQFQIHKEVFVSNLLK